MKKLLIALVALICGTVFLPQASHAEGVTTVTSCGGSPLAVGYNNTDFESDTGGSLCTGLAYGPSGKAALTGTLASATCTAAFTPVAGRSFNASMWGTFVGTLQLQRSFDAGVTKLPVTSGGTAVYQWTTPASESAVESEFGVSYYLCVTAYTSGTVNYRLSQ